MPAHSFLILSGRMPRRRVSVIQVENMVSPPRTPAALDQGSRPTPTCSEDPK